MEVGESSLTEPDSRTNPAVAGQDHYIERTANMLVYHPVRKKLD